MDQDHKSPRQILNNTLWTLKLIYKAYPALFSAIFFIQIATSIVPLVRTKVLGNLIDSLTYQSANNLTPWLTPFSIFIVITIISSISLFFQGQLSRIQDIKLQAYLRKMFSGKISNLDYQHLEGKDTANLISKVDEEFGWRIRQTADDINNIFFNLVSFIAITTIILPKYPLIWLILIISQIPQYFVQRIWVQKDWEIFEKYSDKNKQMWDMNYQLRSKNYISELRINNAINYLYKKFSSMFDFFANYRVDIRIQQIPSEIIMILFSTGVITFCLLLLIKDVTLGVISIGIFVFLFDVIRQTSDLFRGLVFNSVSITENSYHISNFRQIMSLENKITGGTIKLNNSQPPKIEFRNVSFHYPDSPKYIFKNLNLTINPEEELAIVGANGAGKSTLVKLICHFYEPTTGQILINGIDLKTIRLTDWYQNLSFLAQEFNPYSNLSLKENVTIGNPLDNNDSKVIEALNKADALFYKKYKTGLDTLMSHRYGGEEPSWGQWQKIAIARIFYRNAPIMILDEPTSSIDAVSEFKIFNRLYKTVSHKTLIIVSHRFSTVRNAQRIIVLDKGKIIEIGSHQQLLKLKGLYAHSFNLQAKGYE